MSPANDLYRILGVRRNASKATIAKAFRRLARQTHPDCGGDSVQFQAAHRAYKVLSDDARRAKYDATGEVEEDTPDRLQGETLSMVSQCLDGIMRGLLKDRRSVATENVVQLMRDSFTQVEKEIKGRLKESQALRSYYQAALERFEPGEEGSNLMADVARHHVQVLESQEKRMEADLQTVQRAVEFLKDIKYRADVGLYRKVLATSASAAGGWVVTSV